MKRGYTENYLDVCIEDIYAAISTGNNWPKSMGIVERLELLTNLRSYYEEQDTPEGYRKCAYLSKGIGILEVFKSNISGSNIPTN
jgi:hypothetical protein